MAHHDVRVRNHVQVAGTGGATVVLAHGFGCDQRVWGDIAEDLAQDHRVVLFDHVGSGRSDLSAWNPRRYAGLEGYATDVLELFDALGLNEALYVGHSIGCSIGMLAAIERPQPFRQMVFIAPNPCFLNDPATGYQGGFDLADIEELLDLMDRNMLGWAELVAPLAMKNADRPELTRRFRDGLCGGDPAIVRHFARVVFLSDMRACLPRVTVPSVILQAEDDSLAPAGAGAYLQRHLPHACLVQMKATGHCPHISAPHETVALIRRHALAGGEPGHA